MNLKQKMTKRSIDYTFGEREREKLWKLRYSVTDSVRYLSLCQKGDRTHSGHQVYHHAKIMDLQRFALQIKKYKVFYFRQIQFLPDHQIFVCVGLYTYFLYTPCLWFSKSNKYFYFCPIIVQIVKILPFYKVQEQSYKNIEGL